MAAIIELRVYSLRPGTRDGFHRRFTEEVGPMLARFGIAVIAAESSLHDQCSFTLVRAFASLAEREKQLARFYGSEEWLSRHDEPVMAMIESYSTCVVDAAAFAEDLRKAP